MKKGLSECVLVSSIPPVLQTVHCLSLFFPSLCCFKIILIRFDFSFTLTADANTAPAFWDHANI